jgi:hypothetical protein
MAYGTLRIATTLAALLLTGAADPGERVVQPGETVPVNVNGQVRRLRIEPGAPGLALLTTDYAEAAALKPGKMLQIGIVYLIGNERVVAKTAVTRIGIDGAKPAKHRVAWTPRSYAAGVDAVIGPEGLDEPVVRFILHPSRPGERTVAIPMASTAWFGRWFGQRGEVMVGADRLVIRFDPLHRRTVANALAAQRLAALLGGRFDGPAVPTEIAFGIERPARPMALARPLAIGPLLLGRLQVRTAPDRDGGSVAGIEEAGAPPPPEPDPDEVVVVAKKGKKLRPGTLTLGADDLDHCSSLVFDQPRKEIRLTCG